MNILKTLTLALILTFCAGTPLVSADQIFTPTGSRVDLDLQNGKNSGANRTDHTDSFVSSVEGSMIGTFGNTFTYFRGSNTGEKGAFALLVNVARDIKNVFIFVAIIYLVLSVLRMLLSAGSDEDVKK